MSSSVAVWTFNAFTLQPTAPDLSFGYLTVVGSVAVWAFVAITLLPTALDLSSGCRAVAPSGSRMNVSQLTQVLTAHKPGSRLSYMDSVVACPASGDSLQGYTGSHTCWLLASRAYIAIDLGKFRPAVGPNIFQSRFIFRLCHRIKHTISCFSNPWSRTLKNFRFLIHFWAFWT